MSNNSQMDSIIGAHNKRAEKGSANAKKEVVLNIIEECLRTCPKKIESINIKLAETAKDDAEKTFWLSVGHFEKRGTIPKEIDWIDLFEIFRSLGFNNVNPIKGCDYLEWGHGTGYIYYEYKYCE